MKEIIRNAPPKYKQPVRDYVNRDLIFNPTSAQEVVDYVPDCHMRIWYNNQLDSYAPHHHDALEIILCVENNYKAIVKGQQYLLSAGDILFIPPYQLHELVCSSDGIRFIFLIDIRMLRSLKAFQTMIPIFTDAFFCTRKTCPQIYSEVHSQLMKIVDLYFANQPFWETRIFAQLMETFSTIGQNYFQMAASSDDAPPNYKNREHYEKMSALVDYINQNYAENISLEDAASFTGFSKFHFTRLFKQYTNFTFYDYLSHKRIQEAQILLSTDASVTDIALQTGFNNVTTFSRCFKKFAACSPSEYRKRARREDIL